MWWGDETESVRAVMKNNVEEEKGDREDQIDTNNWEWYEGC